MEYKKFFRKVWFNTILKFKKSFNPSYKLGDVNETTSKAYLICHRVISSPDSILTIAPLTYKRYIRSKDDKLFIIMKEHSVTIVNHVYSYDITLGSRMMFKLKNRFDSSLEERRMSIEKEVTNNVTNSLDKIIEGLDG